MKKSTKIITTAVALVLVMGFMVVGILAATSASASITASVSWEATQGLEFDIYGGTLYTKEHKEFLEKNGNSFDSFDGGNGIVQGWEARDKFSNTTTLATVDTTTTNQTASGISATLNATFIDDSDDGVNNPRDIYYWYMFKPFWDSMGNTNSFKIVVTSVPESNDIMEVTYYSADGWQIEFIPMEALTNCSTTKPSQLFAEKESWNTPIVVIKLSIKNPNESITNFNANVGFSITKA